MRNLKKFLSLLLAVMMIATAGIVVSAEAEADYTEAVEVLKTVGVLKGYGNGNFGEKDSVTRIQFALLIARMVESKYTDADQTYFEEYYGEYEGAFSDMVTEDYDYSAYEGAANYCDLAGIVKGVSKEEKLFNPTGKITLDEAITMVARAIGFESDVWPVSFRIFANDNGLLENLETVDWKDELTREETAQLLYNLIKVLSGDEYAYAGEGFVDFQDLAWDTVIDEETTALSTIITLNDKKVAEIACPVVEADYEVLYDTALEELEAEGEDAYSKVVCYELYDGTVAGVYLVGEFNGKFDETAAIVYEDGSEDALTADMLRYAGVNEDGEIVLVDEDEVETTYALDEETIKTLVANAVYNWAFDGETIVAIAETKVENGLGILTGIEIEEVDGEFTGNFIVTVRTEATGFEKDETYVVRSIAAGTVKYENEWEDTLAEDLTIEEIIMRDNAVYEAYVLLSGMLENKSWLVDIETDELGKVDVSAWETYRAELVTVNEFASKNVLSYVDGMTWNDGDKDGVIDAGEVDDKEELGVYTENNVFLKWEKIGDTHSYDAKGLPFTLDAEVTYVVVNNFTGKIEIFQNEPMQGQWLCGNYAYKTLVKDGYCVVVVDETTGPFDLAPRAQYVQVENLKGYVKMVKDSIEIGGYSIPLYTYDYTIKGMTDVATGETLADVKFEALTEAQHSALKTEMSVWKDYVVENEFIYKLHTNDEHWTEEVVPFMYYEVSTWAEYWEEYDVYEATMSWVDGTTLLNHQDLFFEMFDLWEAWAKDLDLDDYAPAYEDLEAVAYLAYPGTDSDAISKYYTYDVGLVYDETNDLLNVHYAKVGVLVETGKYDYDVDGDGTIEDNEKNFDINLYFNMPGYFTDYDEVLTEEVEKAVYVPFGTNLYVEASEANIRQGDSAKGYIKVAGKDVEVVLKDGKTFVQDWAAAERAAIDNWAEINLNEVEVLNNQNMTEWANTSLANIDNIYKIAGDNEKTTQYITWNENDVDNLTVQYQKFSVKKGKGVLGGEMDGVNYTYPATIEIGVETLENEETVNVADWTVKALWAFYSAEAFETAKAEGKDRIWFSSNEEAFATKYAYVKFESYAAGNSNIEALPEEYSYGYNHNIVDDVAGYYMVETNKDAYLAQFEADGETLKADVDQTIFAVAIDLEVSLITLNVVDEAKIDGDLDKTAPDQSPTEVDVIDIAFVDAYADQRNDKGELVELPIEWDEVDLEAQVTGWIIDLELDGGLYGYKFDKQDRVEEVKAHNWYKVVINSARVGTLETSAQRSFSTLSAEEKILDAEDYFMVGLVAAYSVLVEILLAARNAIMGL